MATESIGTGTTTESTFATGAMLLGLSLVKGMLWTMVLEQQLAL